jgi:hypothetical protein
MEILLFGLFAAGFGCLLISTHSWAYDGLRYAIPWWVAWFVLHGALIVIEILRVKGIIG